MKTEFSHFHEHEAIHELKHYLPTQAPLKDFIHHNTLHSFQALKFHNALRTASGMLGYKVYLRLDEYRQLYQQGVINDQVLEKVISQRSKEPVEIVKKLVLEKDLDTNVNPRIGMLRKNWKDLYKINLDKMVHPLLFRLLSNYLDQGISIHHFPTSNNGFMASVKEIAKSSYVQLFRGERAQNLLLNSACTMEQLLKILVGDEALYMQYLFDQQFTHPGWSGMVSVLEDNGNALLDPRKISLRDLIILELLMEIDVMDTKLGKEWQPLSRSLFAPVKPLFDEVPGTELSEALAILQEAYEWSYYEQVLDGLVQNPHLPDYTSGKTFEAFFCIDDREYSLKRYLEKLDPHCRTHSTPGFFNVECYFQPEHSKFHTKICPAPLSPKYLIKELDNKSRRDKDMHFTKRSHSLITGLLISQTLGFWSAFKLFINIFKPSIGPATSYSFRHMDKQSKLTIENANPEDREHGLQVGFTLAEMADRMEGLLKSTGQVNIQSPLVYMVGHGASSVNNTHYAGYDCGACSGRPGSVNARAISYMGNHPRVRELLKERNIQIGDHVQFIGALHDTTRDEIEFYDEDKLSKVNLDLHKKNKAIFKQALNLNAKERSRRFILTETKKEPEKVHEKVKLRSVSLFEPRPELNHATNTLCIVGRRYLTKELFLDRRAFLNSFDYKVDPEGKYLLNILKAAAPVCGGINLEYYFSRVDNYKLGAGTKLPHNVMGLIGVANGADGDLRPGLPLQMIEVHDPIRLMIIVEHFPEVLLQTIMKSPETYEWFINEWVHLVAIHPETKEIYRFSEGGFNPYKTLGSKIPVINDLNTFIESTEENLPVMMIHDN